jgi:hypothetical protein
MQTANRPDPVRARLVVLKKVAEDSLLGEGGPLECLAEITAALGRPIGPNKLNVGDRQRSHFQHQHSLDLPCSSKRLAKINSRFTEQAYISRRTKTPIRRRRRQYSRTFPPLGQTTRNCGPANRDAINHPLFNLDNFTFIRYVFKCNRTSAGTLIRIRLSIMLLLRATARRDRQAAVANK